MPAGTSPWTPRATHWMLKTRALVFSECPLLMGIINVTPDSFSDPGQFLDPARAIEHGQQLVDQGADLLDVGGESTRPYAQVVPAQEELRRVLPVIKGLATTVKVPISIDTCKAAVARAAIDAGAEIINDVSALTGDPGMPQLALESGVGVCVMHMQGTPRTMQDNPCYEDVVREVYDYLRQRRDALRSIGISQDRIVVDPGIGFGKTHRHNLDLLAACRVLHALGCPILVGHSRKGFIGKVLGDPGADRLPGTIGVALALALQGIQILRVHDVAPVRQALRLFEAAGGLREEVGRTDAIQQPG